MTANPLTRAQSVQRLMDYYDPIDLARRVGVAIPDLPIDTQALSQSIKEALRNLTPHQLFRAVVPTLTDEEIKSIDDVRTNRLVRAHRADWEAAALGNPTELERERAAIKSAAAANDAAPSAEDIAKLYQAPTITPTWDPGGRFVESAIMTRWVVGDDGRPKEVEIDLDDLA